MLREWSVEEVENDNQFETRENDFFLRRGGRVGVRRMRGRGGGGRGWSCAGSGGAGVLNAAEASENDFARTGTVNDLDDAVVFGRVMDDEEDVDEEATRVANECVIGGSGSLSVSTMKIRIKTDCTYQRLQD